MSLLEERVCLSDSIIWGLQKRFYEQKGISAWGQKIVPCYITTNPWIATQYAKVVIGYIQDMLTMSILNPNVPCPRFDPTEPIYIIEYGAGSGRLGFYFIRAIKRLRETLSFLQRIKIVYVMSDFTMCNISFWLDHEKLQPYFEEGILDCAVVDAQSPFSDIHLIKSQKTLTPGSIVNPMVAIGNYFFCVVEADAFLVDRDGNLTEGLVTSRSTIENDDLNDVAIIERIRKTFTQVPVDANTRYVHPDHPALNAVLQSYHQLLRDKGYATSFLMPSGATRCVEGLVRLCKGHENVLVLCGDKGYNSISELEGRVGYPMSVEGSFSFMANMDGMGRYFTARGGSAIWNPVKVEAQGDTCLAVACYLTDGQLSQYPNTYTAFHEGLGCFSPSDFYQFVHVMSIHEPGQPPPVVQPSVDLHPENRYLDTTGDMSTITASDEPAPQVLLDAPETKLRWQSCTRDAADCGFSLQQLLAAIRMSHFDPYVFWQIRARVLVLASILYDEEKKEVQVALDNVFDNFFFIHEDDDLPFELGRAAYQLQLDNYDPALKYYKESVRLFGPHYITYYNIALCYNETGRREQGLQYLEKAIELNPDYEPARTAMDDLMALAEPDLWTDDDNDFVTIASDSPSRKISNAAKRLSQLSVSREEVMSAGSLSPMHEVA